MPEGIPNDPRHRTRNHARLDITLWFNVPDDVLKDRKDATDVVRKAIEDVVADDNYKEKFIQAMADAYGVKLISDVTYRVGK